MCGRFCCSLNTDDLRNELHKENVLPDRDTEWVDQESYRPSYNVCPSRSIPAVLEKGQTQNRVMQSIQWGFVPSWLKNYPLNKPINARAETLEEKNSMFDKSKNVSRCIIVAEGFFEWNKKRQAFFVKRRDNKLMLFAGLYSTATIDGRSITTCTIVTTAASKFFSKIHNRMPVILEPATANTWINNKIFWSTDLIRLLTPFDGELNCYQVSDKVGPVKNDGADLVKPLDEHKSSISHFLKPAAIQDEISKDLSPHVEKASASSASSSLMPSSATATANTYPPASTNKKRKKSLDDASSVSKTPKITQFFSKK